MVTSRHFQQDLLPAIQNSYFSPQSRHKFFYYKVLTVDNESLLQKVLSLVYEKVFLPDIPEMENGSYPTLSFNVSSLSDYWLDTVRRMQKFTNCILMHILGYLQIYFMFAISCRWCSILDEDKDVILEKS